MGKIKKTWLYKLPETLQAYSTVIRTATQATPDSLFFREEAVVLLKVQLPSLRVALHEEITNEERDNAYFAELEALNKKRLAA